MLDFGQLVSSCIRYVSIIVLAMRGSIISFHLVVTILISVNYQILSGHIHQMRVVSSFEWFEWRSLRVITSNYQRHSIHQLHDQELFRTWSSRRTCKAQLCMAEGPKKYCCPDGDIHLYVPPPSSGYTRLVYVRLIWRLVFRKSATFWSPPVAQNTLYIKFIRWENENSSFLDQLGQLSRYLTLQDNGWLLDFSRHCCWDPTKNFVICRLTAKFWLLMQVRILDLAVKSVNFSSLTKSGKFENLYMKMIWIIITLYHTLDNIKLCHFSAIPSFLYRALRCI